MFQFSSFYCLLCFLVDQSGQVSHALLAIRNARGKIRREQRHNFAPYSKTKQKQKPTCWSVKMVCLSGSKDEHTPSTAAIKEMLVEAGLGEKKIVIPDIACSKEEFLQIITSNFPKLKNCGGFELLRCSSNSKTLEVILSKVSRTTKLLKAIIGSGRIFIRPIQQDLDTDPLEKDGISSPEVLQEFVLSFVLTLKRK